MLDIQIEQKIVKLLRDKEDFADCLGKILKNAAKILNKEYKKEIPVDKGTARKDVQTLSAGKFNYIVTTLTTNEGKRYPLFVHKGTGRFKDGPDRGKGNYTRLAGYTDEDRKRFAGMAKRGVKFNIKPNKFALRARDNAAPLIKNYILKEFDNLLEL